MEASIHSLTRIPALGIWETHPRFLPQQGIPPRPSWPQPRMTLLDQRCLELPWHMEGPWQVHLIVPALLCPLAVTPVPPARLLCSADPARGPQRPSPAGNPAEPSDISTKNNRKFSICSAVEQQLHGHGQGRAEEGWKVCTAPARGRAAPWGIKAHPWGSAGLPKQWIWAFLYGTC